MTSEKFEGSNCYQNSAGVDSPKSALETVDHVLRVEHIDPFNVTPHQGWSTHKSALPLNGTQPYSCFEGNPTDKSRVSPPVACREPAQKHPLHGRENLHHRGVVQPQEQQELCSSILELKENVPRVLGGHHPSYIMVWWAVSPLHFCKKRVKLVSECIKRTCYKEL